MIYRNKQLRAHLVAEASDIPLDSQLLHHEKEIIKQPEQQTCVSTHIQMYVMLQMAVYCNNFILIIVTSGSMNNFNKLLCIF